MPTDSPMKILRVPEVIARVGLSRRRSMAGLRRRIHEIAPNQRTWISFVFNDFQFRIEPPLPTSLGCYELRPTTLGHTFTELPPIIWSPIPARSLAQSAPAPPVNSRTVRNR